MSLSTHASAGGGGASGGIALAHQANSMGQGGLPPLEEPTVTSAGVPPSPAALGADLVDKQQGLSVKQVKSLAHLPIVAIDLHANDPHVAYFPPKPKEPTTSLPPILVGKMKRDLYFKPDEAANKTLRKYLSKSKTFLSLRKDTLAKATDPGVVMLAKSPQLMGLRRLDDIPAFVRSQLVEEATSPAIAEEASKDVGVTVTNSTLDGSVPQGDDFDRVVYKVRLNASKKALAVLPEEAVEILLHIARYHVALKCEAKDIEEDNELVEYPCAVALPCWASHDAAVEALLDAAGAGCVFFPRAVCALAGALFQRPNKEENMLVKRLDEVNTALQQEYHRQKAQNPDVHFLEDVMIILFGMTDEGFECTAVQVARRNSSSSCCPLHTFNVLSNVGYQCDDPLSRMEQCSKELEEALDRIAPDADGPGALIAYGSTPLQEKIQTKWNQIKASQSEWKDVPFYTTKSDCAAMGAAILGAVSHGRLFRVAKGPKARAAFAMEVYGIAPCAVGVQMNYHGGDSNKWTAVKTLFDFDRRVPAGPYAIDLSAAECAVHRSGKSDLSEEHLAKAVKDVEGSKGIPLREEAALNFSMRVLQKWTRDCEWKPVGDVMEPLVKADPDDKDKKREGCERVTIEISLGTTGLLTTNMIGERESVVQATKSAWYSSMRFYLGIVVAVLFFGGFLAKSYYDEFTFNRDYNRLMAFYNNILPGSDIARDERNARYLVWKYRNKRERLWAMVEKKYGHPVPLAHEWDEINAGKRETTNASASGDGENVDLDKEDDLDKEGTKETAEDGENAKASSVSDSDEDLDEL